MFLIGAFAFFAAEVAAFVAVGEQVGFGWALILLIGASALGPLVIHQVGLGVLARARERLDRGDLPGRELLDGVVVLAGGIMICVPGFIGDALGVLLMLRPVRRLFILLGGRWLLRRVQITRLARWRPVDARSRPTPRQLTG